METHLIYDNSIRFARAMGPQGGENMEKDALYDFLKSIPAFSMLSDSVLSIIKQNLQKKQYNKGEIIYSEGDTIDSIFLLEIGLVEAYKLNEAGDKVTIWFIYPNEIFCVPTLITGAAHLYAEAVEDSLCYTLSKPVFEKLAKEYAEFPYALLRCLSRRVIEYTDKVTHLTIKSPLEHIAKIILYNSTTDKDGDLICNLNQEQLATTSGQSKRTVARVISQLKEDGALTMKKKRIHVSKPFHLRAILSGEGCKTC
jgi:CRP/FNR family transcriptional regulator